MTSTVLLDCDDVLLNWLDGFRKYVAAKRGVEICERGPTDWVMDEWLGTEPHETIQLIEEFNASPAFGKLEPVEGAQDAIRMMGVMSDYHVRMHVITSCSSDWATVEMRKTNLREHYGFNTFDSVHCLDLGQSKESILHAFDAPCLWIEDNIKNALLGVKAGHRVVMRQTSHNVRHRADAESAGIVWIEHWNELKLGDYFK
ncbi:phosphoglycolate phosphatase [Dinoroseobacter phage vB_DshS-R5C]|uniref:Phosphoglycolate phosphatase n=1 Tax=Dinoroseobacter phage vB_DshS-R5C TaxID=1965368 RepID=A0A1V0DY91_9CAUD|nr:phosphoglycolate phosphatase [Dinoroseobacter phage vB_DshS-R5C]ARB06132.1 phosphoglycolate phosphatase [Dinoroseobacter phage vB_DshS-R5C]